jgi:hypothetical protein
MENNTNTLSGLPQTLTDSLQQLTKHIVVCYKTSNGNRIEQCKCG